MVAVDEIRTCELLDTKQETLHTPVWRCLIAAVNVVTQPVYTGVIDLVAP
jgi:hypothetical protein